MIDTTIVILIKGCPLDSSFRRDDESDRLPLLFRVQHLANEVVDEEAVLLQHPLNEVMHLWPVGVAFPIFHDPVVEVDVEFFGDCEVGCYQGVVSFIGDACRSVLQGAVAFVGPIAFFRDGHDGVCRSAPELFCALQHVATFELLVGSGEEIERDLAVLSGGHCGGCHLSKIL